MLTNSNLDGKVIAVSGVIGAGKSTFIEAMAGELSIPAFYENVQGNPLIPLMYEDPERWAFTLQMNFLREKYVQMVKAKSVGNCLVERTIFENIMFSKTHYQEGNFNDVEWDVYKKMLDHFSQTAPVPDLMIFLDVSDDLALERIKQRGRPYEQGEDKIPYYLKMNQIYREWVANYNHPKVVVDNGGFDHIHNPAHRQQMVNYILNYLESGEY